MIPLLLLLISVMGSIAIIQFFSKRKLKKQVNEISSKLKEIIEQQTSEKILIHTNDTSIRQLLISTNRLLDQNQKVIADYNKAKIELRKMLSNMSHDLKTPLTVILGYVEKVKYGNLNEEDRMKTTDQLQNKTLSVIDLVNKYFDLVKIESGDYSLPLSRIPINEICRKNVLEFYDLLTSKGLQVEIDIPEEPMFILGNEEALNRILANLISNAIRYGSEGRVFGLSIREEGSEIAIDIWDRGKGISEIHQDRVFERLYTLDDARNPAFQGSGLGLSITKKLTEAMKGSIHLQSVPFERTVFTCLFKRITY